MITFNQKIFEGSWGGGNQFLKQFCKYLKKKNYDFNFKLSKKTKIIFVVNSKTPYSLNPLRNYRNKITFGYKQILKFKKKYNDTIIVQRINDSDDSRQTNFINENFKKINNLSDKTIFVSKYISNYYFENNILNDNIDFKIINAAADSEIFNLTDINLKKMPTGKLNIVTHHWSDNYSKGFLKYKQLDDLLDGDLKEKFNFTLIGNYPKEINWKNTKIIEPLYGHRLAQELKKHHIYFTASYKEASGMHWLEGVQSGLPLLYYPNGGAISDSGHKYGICVENDDIESSLNKIKNNYNYFKNLVYQNKIESNEVCRQYFDYITR